MTKARLEAFSDGVIAIIITIMVLELKVPHGNSLNDLLPLLPVFLSYVLSFIYVGIYWNNHHHMFQTVKKISASILWANLYFLFWLSLFPFVTAWAGENHFSSFPTMLYGIVLFMTGLAYWILQNTIIKSEGDGSLLKIAVGNDFKGKISNVLNGVAILISYWLPLFGLAIYIGVAFIWLIPDKRIEEVLTTKQ